MITASKDYGIPSLYFWKAYCMHMQVYGIHTYMHACIHTYIMHTCLCTNTYTCRCKSAHMHLGIYRFQGSMQELQEKSGAAPTWRPSA